MCVCFPPSFVIHSVFKFVNLSRPSALLATVCPSVCLSINLPTCLFSLFLPQDTPACRDVSLNKHLSHIFALLHWYGNCNHLYFIWISAFLRGVMKKKVPVLWLHPFLPFYYAAHLERRRNVYSIYPPHSCSDPRGRYIWWLVKLLIEDFKHIRRRRAHWKSLWIKNISYAKRRSLTCPQHDFPACWPVRVLGPSLQSSVCFSFVWFAQSPARHSCHRYTLRAKGSKKGSPWGAEVLPRTISG